MQKIKKVLANAKKILVFLSRTFVFSLSKNAAQALQKRHWRLEMVPQFKILKNMHNTLSFQEKNYLQKIKIVLAKNKKSTCKCKKILVILSRTFVFFSLQKRGTGASDAQQALRNGAAVEFFEQYA